MEKILAAVKAKHEAGQVKGEVTLTTGGGGKIITEGTGPSKKAGAVKDKPAAAKDSSLCEPVGSKGKKLNIDSHGNGTVSKLDASGCVMEPDDLKNNTTHNKRGQVDFDKVKGKVDICNFTLSALQ